MSASLASSLLSGGDDVCAWVNSVIASHDEEQQQNSSLDAHVSAVSMKLQILAADLNDELEASMAELLAAVPRTLAEVERIEGAVGTLQGDLSKLSTRLDGGGGPGGAAADDGPASSMQHVRSLEELDRVKRNMETCAATLVEAANWSAAVREANAQFAAGALDKAAERLAAMQHSEEVLRNMPEAAERQARRRRRRRRRRRPRSVLVLFTPAYWRDLRGRRTARFPPHLRGQTAPPSRVRLPAARRSAAHARAAGRAARGAAQAQAADGAAEGARRRAAAVRRAPRRAPRWFWNACPAATRCVCHPLANR